MSNYRTCVVVTVSGTVAVLVVCCVVWRRAEEAALTRRLMGRWDSPLAYPLRTLHWSLSADGRNVFSTSSEPDSTGGYFYSIIDKGIWRVLEAGGSEVTVEVTTRQGTKVVFAVTFDGEDNLSAELRRSDHGLAEAIPRSGGFTRRKEPEVKPPRRTDPARRVFVD